MATRRKNHAAGSDIYARVALENFKSALNERERLKEFDYVFGERYYLHRLACTLEALEAIWGLEQTAKEFTEFDKEIGEILGSLDKKLLRSQRDQCRRRLSKYYKTKDEEALDLYGLKDFQPLFSTYVQEAIELLGKIIAD